MTAEGGDKGRREGTGGEQGRERGEKGREKNVAPLSFLKVGAYAYDRIAFRHRRRLQIWSQ